MADGPFSLNDDGSAKDPVAFQQALRNDPVKMQALENDPEIGKVVLGEDTYAFQDLLRSIYEVRMLELP